MYCRVVNIKLLANEVGLYEMYEMNGESESRLHARSRSKTASAHRARYRKQFALTTGFLSTEKIEKLPRLIT